LIKYLVIRITELSETAPLSEIQFNLYYSQQVVDF